MSQKQPSQWDSLLSVHSAKIRTKIYTSIESLLYALLFCVQAERVAIECSVKPFSEGKGVQHTIHTYIQISVIKPQLQYIVLSLAYDTSMPGLPIFRKRPFVKYASNMDI